MKYLKYLFICTFVFLLTYCQSSKSIPYTDILDIDSIVFECIDINTMTIVDISPSIFENISLEKKKQYVIENKDEIKRIAEIINKAFQWKQSDGIDTRGKILFYHSSDCPLLLYYGSTDIQLYDKTFLLPNSLRETILRINGHLYNTNSE